MGGVDTTALYKKGESGVVVMVGITDLSEKGDRGGVRVDITLLCEKRVGWGGRLTLHIWWGEVRQHYGFTGRGEGGGGVRAEATGCSFLRDLLTVIETPQTSP